VWKGEYVWVIPVVPDDTIGVIMRSSIRADGASADAGADSIRAWLGRIPDGAPWAPKVHTRWTTRKTGWRARLHRVIAELLALAAHIRRCPACGAWMKLTPCGTRLRCDARTEGFLDFGANGQVLEIPGVKCGQEIPVEDRPRDG
jgi:hypothetical protein